MEKKDSKKSIFNVNIDAIPATIKEIAVNNIKWFNVNDSSILDITTTLPDLALSIANNPIKLINITKVLIDPVTIKKFSGFMFLQTDVEIIAACAEPNPGSEPVSKEEDVPAVNAFVKSLLLTSGNSIFCFGIVVFWVILVTKIETPNKPENKGSKG